MNDRQTASSSTHRILVVGRPNAGKTSVFNRLTGHRLKTGNYHGVTVEHAEGTLQLSDRQVSLIDLPGTPSLIPTSPDEGLTSDALLNHALGQYQAVLVVVDALRLIEGLYFALQVIELGIPTVIAINQIDLARAAGMTIHVQQLIHDLSQSGTKPVQVLTVSALHGEGFDQLLAQLLIALDQTQSKSTEDPLPWRSPTVAISQLYEAVTEELGQHVSSQHRLFYLQWSLLAAEEGEAPLPPTLRLLALSVLKSMEGQVAVRSAEEVITTRYQWLDAQHSQWVSIDDAIASRGPEMRSRQIDRWVLHPFWGSLIFMAFMILLFQALFVGADPFIGIIEDGVSWLGDFAKARLPTGIVTEFVIEGLINGIGNVIVFLPQVLILFGLIGLMEDSGYMARAAALVDRVMRKAGLSGRAFVPMLSGFICAVPAILATRTLPQRRDRLLTMMSLPLLTCSARLPVYTLLIATLLPTPGSLLGIDQRAWVMVALYLFATLSAFTAVWVMGRTILKGEAPPLLLHLPAYRRPIMKDVTRRLLTRAGVFIKEAGTVILLGTIVLWFLLSFPRLPDPPSQVQTTEITMTSTPIDAEAQLAQLRAQSYGGQLGRVLEPALKPLGWDWQVGVGLIGAFAAREVFVSTLGMVYGVGGEVDEESRSLRERIRAAKHSDGRPVFTPVSALALLIFFSLACQCLSTLAAVKRETGGYRWPLFMFSYMSILAYGCALVVTWIGRLIS